MCHLEAQSNLVHRQKESSQQEPKVVYKVRTAIRGILMVLSVLWIIVVFIGVKYLIVKKTYHNPKEMSQDDKAQRRRSPRDFG